MNHHKQTIRVFSCVWTFFFLLIAIAQILTFSVANLDKTQSFHYSYSIDTSHLSNNYLALPEYKYIVEKISLGHYLQFNVNQTISTKNLTNQLLPQHKFFHTIYSRDIQLDDINISWFATVIWATIASCLCLLIIYGCWRLFMCSCKIIQYQVSNLSRMSSCCMSKFTHTERIMAIIFPMVTIGIFIYSYLSHSINMELYFNSDELFLPHLFKDLANGGLISDWSLTRTPFFFPDYIIFTLAYLIDNNAYFTFLYYAIFQLLYYYLLLFLLFYKFFTIWRAMSIAGLTLFISTVLAVMFKPYIIIVLSIFHFGCFLNQILLLVLIINFFESKNKVTGVAYYLIFAIIVFLAALSDEFIGVWFIAPMLLAILVIFKENILSNSKMKLIIFGLIVFSVLGVISYNWFISHPNRPSADLVGFSISELFKRLFYLLIFIRENLIICVINIFFVLLLFSLSFKFIASSSSFKAKLIQCINLSVGISFLFTLCTIYCFPFMDYSWRYMIPMLFIPIAYFSLLLEAAHIGAKILILCIGLLICSYSDDSSLKYTYYPADVACIDNVLTGKHFSGHGISQYWNSRRFNFLTHTDADVVQIDGEKHTHYMFQDSIKHTYKYYDFAIVDNVQDDEKYSIYESTISRSPNNMTRVVQCPKHKIYLFQLYGLTLY